MGAGLKHESSDESWVDLPRRPELPLRDAFDLVEDAARLVVRELDRRRQLDVEDALLLSDEPLELLEDLGQLDGATLLGHEQEEVADELVRVLQHGA
jgi:hypothetical protein